MMALMAAPLLETGAVPKGVLARRAFDYFVTMFRASLNTPFGVPKSGILASLNDVILAFLNTSFWRP